MRQSSDARPVVAPSNRSQRHFFSQSALLGARAASSANRRFSYAEDGSVDGVYAQDAFGDIINYKATALILATGGFANDDKRLIRQGFVLEELERIGTPGHYGDAINMAITAGCSEYTGVCYLKYNRISHDFEVETFGPFW